MKKAYDFLKACGVFYLATADGDQPRVRPFGAVAVFEERLYLITGNGKMYNFRHGRGRMDPPERRGRPR